VNAQCREHSAYEYVKNAALSEVSSLTFLSELADHIDKAGGPDHEVHRMA
jgi:hypothetical protein